MNRCSLNFFCSHVLQLSVQLRNSQVSCLSLFSTEIDGTVQVLSCLKLRIVKMGARGDNILNDQIGVLVVKFNVANWTLFRQQCQMTHLLSRANVHEDCFILPCSLDRTLRLESLEGWKILSCFSSSCIGVILKGLGSVTVCESLGATASQTLSMSLVMVLVTVLHSWIYMQEQFVWWRGEARTLVLLFFIANHLLDTGITAFGRLTSLTTYCVCNFIAIFFPFQFPKVLSTLVIFLPAGNRIFRGFSESSL